MVIFFDMPKHSQRARFLVVYVITKDFGEVRLEFCAQLVGKVVDVDKVCIKGAAIESGKLAEIRNGNFRQFMGLQKLNKGPFNFFDRRTAALIVLDIHKTSLIQHVFEN